MQLGGDLVMVWRQQGGKGRWVGPLRALIQEGATVWLATGSAIVKAKVNQCRPVTRREELQSNLEGTAVMKTPVTLDALLRQFSGKRFTNICGEAPSEEQRQQDVSETTVALEPKNPKGKFDTWKNDDEKWLIRVHQVPRLALFSPMRMGTCPVPETQLTGLRRTYVQPVIPKSKQVLVEDDFKESEEPHRHLTERWTGEMWFEKSTSAASSPDKAVTEDKKRGPKRKAQSLPGTPRGQPSTTAPEGEVLPPTPAGMPATPRPGFDEPQEKPQERGTRSAIGNQCAVKECMLPGGHEGLRLSSDNKRFHWNSKDGRVDEEDSTSSSSSESSSSSLEEMIADEKRKPRRKKPPDKRQKKEASMFMTVEKDTVFCVEIEVDQKDIQWLMNHPAKSSIWMSKKVMEKGKEKEWQKMTMDEKMSFDLAQAKELSQVLQSKALRSLTIQEQKNLDPKTAMSMRWVLTTKSDGTSKARLVVLGYQAPNLVSVQTASPTMSRLSRNMLLTMCANSGVTLRGGDVTSAFLQADQSLEDQQLTVWAPSELAVLFGAAPESPTMALRVCRAFYGLVQAPREWFEHLASTLTKIGYKSLKSDRCIFILQDESLPDRPVKSIVGCHVDDLLVGGVEGCKIFEAAFAKLKGACKWGRWDTKDFTFTGCNISTSSDQVIKLSQKDYTERWIEEISIAPDRAKQTGDKATPAEISALRGCIGTMAWRSSQSSPQFLADAGLLLSEVPYATVRALVKANKVVREMRREAAQALCFFPWKRAWRDIAIVGWADASQKNRPDHSSTMGIVLGMTPKEFLSGEELPVSLIQWKSTRAPRQVLGSNGAEVQAVTETEDMVFRARALWCEMNGLSFERDTIYSMVKDNTSGAVVMDTRGIFDAATRNVSSLHGLRSSRSGYELTISVSQACQVGTEFRWVHGGVQLGDSLTKWGSRKVLLQFFAGGQRWKLVHDPKFVAGRKVRKKELERLMRERQDQFFAAIKALAEQYRWPWEPSGSSLRSMGDESLGIPCIEVPPLLETCP